MRLLLLAFALIAASTVHAQQRAEEPIFLDFADSLKSATVDSQTVRTFLGHVKFRQGALVITCTKAVQNLSTNVADLSGNVHIADDTMTITAPHAVYNGATRVASADGGVQLTDRTATLTAHTGTYDAATHIASFHDKVKIVNDTATITADNLIYNRLTEFSTAAGRVTVVDSSAVITCDALTNDRLARRSWCAGHVRVRGRQDRSTLFGDSLFQDETRRYSRIPRAPLLVHVDSTRADSTAPWRFDTMFVTAHSMEALRNGEETYLAHDSVAMFRGDMQARCGEGRFARSADAIGLGKNPIVWLRETQLTADTITMLLRDNRPQSLVADGAAFALAQRDSLFPLRFDQLAGGRLTMRFREDSLRAIRVEKNALSVYFGFDEDKPRGVNRCSGDTIDIELKKNKPDLVYTLGGGEGQYYSEKLVRKKELDFRLTGFDDRAAERPRRREFVVP